MKLEIYNANRIAAIDHKIVGSAVKIIAAGGSILSGEAMLRACGSTEYWWKDKAASVRALVVLLEAEK
jgi:hypothetical protein